MKLFKTNNVDIVWNCQKFYNFDLPRTQWSKRDKKFEAKYGESDNLLCKVLPINRSYLFVVWFMMGFLWLLFH